MHWQSSLSQSLRPWATRRKNIVNVDYMSKQVDGLRKNYQNIAAEVNDFMVLQGQ